jgi:hypothetical protein
MWCENPMVRQGIGVMNTGLSWRRGGSLAVVSMVAMLLYFLLMGQDWPAVAMGLGATVLWMALPRRRRPVSRGRRRNGGMAEGHGPR